MIRSDYPIMLIRADLEWCLTNKSKQRGIYGEAGGRTTACGSVAADWRARYLEIQKEKKNKEEKKKNPTFHADCIQHLWVSDSEVTDIALQVLKRKPQLAYGSVIAAETSLLLVC